MCVVHIMLRCKTQIAEHLQWVCGDRSQTEAGDDRELTGDGKSSPVLSGNRLSSQHQYCLICK